MHDDDVYHSDLIISRITDNCSYRCSGSSLLFADSALCGIKLISLKEIKEKLPVQ